VSVFDYMNLVSGYIINKLENKRDMEEALEICIKPTREPYTNKLCYEVRETKNYREQVFYMKFACANKEEFYSALNNLLVQYLKNSDLIMYTATSGNEYTKNKISFVAKNRACVSFEMEDEQDILVFSNFKNYLDEKRKSKESEENLIKETENLEEILDEVKTYGKIML